ncbi:ATP-binding protein [Trichocoleus sp. FACHB-262]|uniref:ATP-binding response regulator n=1 Tax=Trichocoleus sp. FACHB-262 TaxID=2692869 RepID=UPI0018F018AB|nr:ATP-binding protein [Trichocoleus sp. FACHB-262]
MNERKQPIGLLNWPVLVSYLGREQSLDGVEPSAIATLNLHQPISAVDLPIITPLLTLPAAWSLSQFWSHLKAAEPPAEAWALVDLAGEFLGLLNYSRLLQLLAPLLTPGAEVIPNSPTATHVTATTARELAEPPVTPSATSAPIQPLALLIRLLEQIPLPLMVQTSTGRVLHHNQCWQQQIGELSELTRLRQAAGTILNTTVDSPLAEFGGSPNQHSQPNTPEVDPEAWPQSATGTNQPNHSPTWQRSPTVRPQDVAGITNKAKGWGAAERSLSTQLNQQIGRMRSGSAKFRQAHPGVTLLNQQMLSSRAQPGTPLKLQQASFAKWPSKASSSTTSSEQQAGLLSFFASSIAQYHCQVGAAEDSCICTCPTDNGQERIWQFSRSLLDLSTWIGDQPNEQQPQRVPIATTSTSPFQLADLGTSPVGTLGQSPPALPSFSPQEALWLVLAQDHTDQQVNRTLAAKNADLVQLNLLKDEFLACISHELKTPLTAVLGLSNLLKDQVLGPLNERQARYASLIYQSGRHLMTVVNNILDLTRMETGQLELAIAPVSLKSTCDRALEQAYQLQFPEEKALVEHMVEAPSMVPCTLEIESDLESIVADEVRLRQMLVNLLSNAIKFTEVSGKISLKVSRWEGWVVFTISDTGIGIAADKQHLIFQKFQQLENPLTRRFEGTGLGLAITQRLARLHGGDVTFISKEGEGSQFTLLLPPSPPQPTLGVPSRDNSSHNRLVLIVESVAQFIEGLADELTSLGYRVAIARSGTEALEKARRLQPCIVFLNPLLPLLSGWDVLTLLKSDAETYHIPVVITATKAEQAQAARYQADGFLCLPIQSQALQDHLAHLTTSVANLDSTSHPTRRLTVLYLSSVEASMPSDLMQHGLGQSTSSPSISAPEASSPLNPASRVISRLSSLLQQHHHRILEADDLEQAELLARVWRPDVLLIDQAIAELPSYFQTLAQQTALASLPLVTLTKAATQAANQVPGLSVFPCLAAPNFDLATNSDPTNSEAAALMQAIQVAVGLNWQPSVLVVDLLHLPDLVTAAARSAPELAANLSTTLKDADWLQALVQYLQTAGLRGLHSHSWAEALRQLKHQSADLLLICLRGHRTSPVVLQALETLNQLQLPIPILVLDQRQLANQTPPCTEPSLLEAAAMTNMVDMTDMVELTTVLGAIATQILPSTLPVEELLEQIYQALSQAHQVAD